VVSTWTRAAVSASGASTRQCTTLASRLIPVLQVADAMTILLGEIGGVRLRDLVIGRHLALEPMGVHEKRHRSLLASMWSHATPSGRSCIDARDSRAAGATNSASPPSRRLALGPGGLDRDAAARPRNGEGGRALRRPGVAAVFAQLGPAWSWREHAIKVPAAPPIQDAPANEPKLGGRPARSARAGRPRSDRASRSALRPRQQHGAAIGAAASPSVAAAHLVPRDCRKLRGRTC
jgi:hypothetical protein